MFGGHLCTCRTFQTSPKHCLIFRCIQPECCLNIRQCLAPLLHLLTCKSKTEVGYFPHLTLSLHFPPPLHARASWGWGFLSHLTRCRFSTSLACKSKSEVGFLLSFDLAIAFPSSSHPKMSLEVGFFFLFETGAASHLPCMQEQVRGGFSFIIWPCQLLLHLPHKPKWDAGGFSFVIQLCYHFPTSLHAKASWRWEAPGPKDV